MKFIEVTGTPITVVCINCGKHVWAGDRKYDGHGRQLFEDKPTMADIEGEPFKAYYCGECYESIQAANDR